jgi:hypothetical protein
METKNHFKNKSLANIFFLVLLFVFMVSCQSRPATKESFPDETKVYMVSLENTFDKTHSVQLSTIGSEIEYIPLETNRKSVLSKITKIALSEPYLFVTDKERLHQFNREGRFIRQIGSKGRGPGEYQGLFIWDICVNDSLNQLIALSIHTHIFDFDGNFIKQFRNDTINNVERVFPWKENQFIYYYWNAAKYMDPNEYSLIILNENGETITTYKNHHKRIQQPSFGFNQWAPFYLFQNKIRFKEFGVDTLYTVEKDQFTPHAIFDLGNKAPPADIFIPDTKNMSGIFKGFTGKFWIKDIVEDDENFYLSLFCPADLITSRMEDILLQGVCPKVSCDAKILDNGFQNNIDGGLPFFPKYIYNDSILVDWVDAFDLRQHVLKNNSEEMRKLYGQKYDVLVKLAKSLNDESNPIKKKKKK